MAQKKVKGALSDDPFESGSTWLQLDDTCKVHLSATETQKYLEWRESITRTSQNTESSGQASFEDPTESFFRTLAVSTPTSVEGSTRPTTPVAHRKISKKVRYARQQLYENHYVLDRPPPRLRVGELDTPDSLGWRWYQCSADVKVLLPPDVGVQYSAFLKLEDLHLNRATSSKTVNKFNKARQRFNELCIQSKSRHPVRGIVSTARRYALPVGFRSPDIDRLLGRPQDDSEYLMPEHLPKSSKILSEADEYGRRWLSTEGDIQVLLPADTAAQLAFLCRNGVSQPTHPLMRQLLTDFQRLSYEITTKHLLASWTRIKLYMFSSESHLQVLDEAVAHIEVNISRSTRKEVKHTSLHPRWRDVVHELVDFPVPSRGHPIEEEDNSMGAWSPGVVRRRIVRRRGKRNLKAGNVNKELPPLPPETVEQNVGARLNATSGDEKIWIRRKTRILT